MLSTQEFIEACRDKGLNVTYQRILIFKVLSESQVHPTAEEIYKSVKEEYPSISLATVYKTLETLVEKDLIRKVNPLHDTARYDGDSARHHHMVCHYCGKLIDVHDQAFQNLPLPQHPDFEITGFRILFEGVCDDEACREKACRKSDGDEKKLTLCGK
ncbi:MAG: transcriptional repressor [Calditrichaeota bacterium]|nr:transcriptional repressor [Calditrichota bacterium]HQU74933.1 transcriptional repressor [Calditrichia bacterium]